MNPAIHESIYAFINWILQYLRHIREGVPYF